MWPSRCRGRSRNLLGDCRLTAGNPGGVVARRAGVTVVGEQPALLRSLAVSGRALRPARLRSQPSLSQRPERRPVDQHHRSPRRRYRAATHPTRCAATTRRACERAPGCPTRARQSGLAGMFFDTMEQNSVGAVGANLKLALGISDTQLTVVNTATVIGGLVGRLLGGWLADRYCRRASLSSNLLLYTLGGRPTHRPDQTRLGPAARHTHRDQPLSHPSRRHRRTTPVTRR